MRHPLLALERVASVTAKQLILETHVDMLHCRRPACAFYPEDELDHNPTNWCGPNPAAVVAMLKLVGFREITVVSQYSLAYRAARALKWSFERRGNLWTTFDQGRIVVHASR